MRTTRFGGPARWGLWLGALASMGCQDTPPPTYERAAVVVVETTPALVHLANQPAQQVFRHGDVVTLDPPVRSFTWHSVLEQGQLAERNGETMLGTRSPSEGALHVFLADLRRDVQVPSAGWICEQLQDALDEPGCSLRLRRQLVTPTSTLAFWPCETGPCPLALINQGRFSIVRLQGLRSVWLATLAGRDLALAERSWTTAGEATASEVVVFQVAQALRRLGVLATRGEQTVGHRSMEQQAEVRVERGALRVVGWRRMVDDEGRELENAALNDAYGLTPEGRLVRVSP